MSLTIAQRLTLGFALVLLLTFGFGWSQLDSLRQMRDFSVETVDNDFEALKLMRRIGNNARDMHALQERAWVTYFQLQAGATTEERSVPQEKWQFARQRTLGLIRELEQYAAAHEAASSNLERNELWSAIAGNAREQARIINEISELVAASFDAINRDSLSGARGREELLDELRQDFAVTSDKASDFAAALAANAQRDIDLLYADVNRFTIVVLAGVVLIGIVLATLILRSITRPLGSLMGFVGEVGRGDLRQRTQSDGNDEIGRLGAALNDMVGSLSDITGQTRLAAENLNAATSEMQASAQQQAASTSEQSAAVQQITSTLEEIAQAGGQISERSKAVAASAEAASGASKSGLDAVYETGRAMQAIREQAERVAQTVVVLTEKTQSVGEIIGSVNDIAERSNLLALNAAIEASSAGEAGRSFSVVADEIKNLADQAKAATGQVHGLLSEIQQSINSAVMQTEEAVKRAEYGADQSSRTEQTITELARSIEQNVATFEQIVAATNQQQIGIEQVSESVQSISEASGQIAAGIVDLEKSAGNLTALSSQLRQSIERYQL